MGAGLALIATVVLVLGDDARLLRLGLLAALWTALLGAFAAARYRKDANARTGEADRLQQIYELELEREIAARREYELEVEAETRRQVEEEVRDESRRELDALRGELRNLRENLEALLGGDVLVERVALRAESTRLRSLSDQSRVIAAHDDEIRSITSSSSSSVVSAEETQIIDALVEVENAVQEMELRSGDGRGIGSPGRNRPGRGDRPHPVEQWRAGAPRREDSGRTATRRPGQRPPAQVPPQARPAAGHDRQEDQSSRSMRMEVVGEVESPQPMDQRDQPPARPRKPAQAPPPPQKQPPARGPNRPPARRNPPQPPEQPTRQAPPPAPKRPTREEPTRQINRPKRPAPAAPPPAPVPAPVSRATEETAFDGIDGWQPEIEQPVAVEPEPTGRRAARGRRAAPEDGDDAGAHASGRSVSELLAAYSDEQPRRHRRRRD